MSRTPKPDGRRGRARPDSRERRSRLLIVCEGAKTEPSYFQSFPVATVDVHVVGEGKSTLSLVDAAVAHERSAKARSAPYDEIWVVFDKDSFGDDDFNAACSRIEGSGKKWHAAWSNPCFEVWYLMHFQRWDSRLDRSVIIEKLSEHLGSYAKNDPAMYDRLRDLLPQALVRARERCAACGVLDRQVPPSRAEPCTLVHRLVERLSREIR